MCRQGSAWPPRRLRSFSWRCRMVRGAHAAFLAATLAFILYSMRAAGRIGKIGSIGVEHSK